jgi:hypothetical protein
VTLHAIHVAIAMPGASPAEEDWHIAICRKAKRASIANESKPWLAQPMAILILPTALIVSMSRAEAYGWQNRKPFEQMPILSIGPKSSGRPRCAFARHGSF